MAQEFTGQTINAGSTEEDTNERNQFDVLGIPRELLSEIFILAIPTRKIVPDSDFSVEESDSKITFALSQVCGYWRTVALATPQIWSSISIVRQDRSVASGPGLVALTRIFIERSNSVPLHITIDMDREWTRGNVSWIPTLLDLIFLQAYRWKSAVIHFEGTDFENTPRLDLPALESLKYKHMSCYSPLFTFGDTPSLRHAIVVDELQNKTEMPLPWSQLWTYDGFPKDLELMRPASSELRTCVLRGSLSHIPYPSTIIVFSKLTSLRVVNRFRTFIRRHTGTRQSIFRWIATPVLENLEIRGVFMHRKRHEALWILVDLLQTTLTRPSTTLRSLSFHVLGMREEALKKLLLSTPCLTTLDICNYPASIFTCLQVPDDSTEPLVPRLQSLTIHNFSHSDVAKLWAVYDSRRPHLKITQDDMKVACLDITFSYRTFRHCHQAQCRLAEGSGVDIKALRLGKIIGWRNHLVKQFLVDFPEKEKKYAVSGNKHSSRRMYSPEELNIFFIQVIENHQFSDPILIEISRIAMILSDIRDLPPIAILDENSYEFRQRTGKVLESWAPLLEDLASRQRWTLGEDCLTLRAYGPTAIPSREN